jgi:F420-dependent oxidoreductase-like protein
MGMQFGAFVPQGWKMDLVGIPEPEQWPTMLAVARRVEDLGYDTVWVYDHFHTVPEASQEPTFECWTVMAAIAAATQRVRLGQMCTCNSYRQPSYMAKVASTVDVISGGRLEFAIGAGWYEEEYLAYGYEFPKGSTRIRQLDEAVQIIKKMWTEDQATFAGKHYSITGAINRPRPLQRPYPPLWIAGSGPELTLKVVAKHADYANYAGSIERFRENGVILDAHCEKIGRDPAEIGRTTHLEIMVGKDEASLKKAAVRAAEQRGRPVDKWLESTLTLAGTTQQVIDALGEFKDEGCAHVIGYFPDAAWGDSIELFATEVIPRVK